MTANNRLLTWQQVIQPEVWARLKNDPTLRERYISDTARQELAALMARDELVTFVVSEPDAKDEDFRPWQTGSAVIRASVSVGTKSQTSEMALALAEAEERGHLAALSAIRGKLEGVLPCLGPTAHARGAVDRLLALVEHNRDHAPASDWRPMWSRRGLGGGDEYLFLDGEVRNLPVVRRPKPATSVGIDYSTDEVVSAIEASEEIGAIGWRPRGRPPVHLAGQP